VNVKLLTKENAQVMSKKIIEHGKKYGFPLKKKEAKSSNTTNA